jgi:prefoldin subunit 5
MNSFDRAQRDYENPPDEEEAVFCEDCGQEVEILVDLGGERYTACTNVFCPDKMNDEVSFNMAEKIVSQEEAIESLQNTLKYVRRKLAWTEEKLAEREATIEKLEKKISALEFRRDEGE